MACPAIAVSFADRRPGQPQCHFNLLWWRLLRRDPWQDGIEAGAEFIDQLT
ncbi:hypothetical protein ECZU23_53140 [Escherichia coli]|nr:hypothetical protein ECZU23_53140 [Escherichia coli]